MAELAVREAPSEEREHRVDSYVVNDLVIQEDSCNLACEYCLTGQSQFKEDHSLLKIFQPPTKLSCRPGTDLHARLQRILKGSAAYRIPVVKISGGEVMLIDGVMELIEELSASHETVVVLTNGIPLSDARLQRFRELGNVVVQLSLDSTRYAGNSYRVPNEAVHEALMRRIHAILSAGLPSEIYLVLNDRSIDDLELTLTDLSSYGDSVTLFPFPVRGPTRERFLPQEDQYDRFFRVLDGADRFGDLLPSEPYLDRLRRFFGEGGRRFRCHLPRIAYTTFDDGTVTSCPNIWFNKVGNAVSDEPDVVMSELQGSSFRRLLLADRPRIDACKACFTPWDPVSLYFEDEIDLDELGRVPIYRGERTRERLRKLREGYRERELNRC